MSVPDEAVNPRVEEIMEQLRAKVAEKRAAGEYPAGLEDALAAHFKRIAHIRDDHLEPLRASISRVRESSHFRQDRISLESRIPGGEFAHGLVAKAVSRQIQGILEQISGFAAAIHFALDSIEKALDSPGDEVAYLLGYADSIVEKVSTSQQELNAIRAELASLKSEVQRLSNR